ncbi:unnamed protein product [Penicillium camemberti]|uniref:Str. FM013 n=1 Tax=Penicillium camemberti (strain FM 013) TaxID=1429867 RepID=A0A0G4P656_PENC3|nr:unnamed protein product [Penicillium camemberti]
MDRSLPLNTPSGPSRRGLDTSRWNPQPFPQRSGNGSARKGLPSNINTTTGGDVEMEMAPLPPSPTYLQVPLPASSSPAKSQ